jgi:nitrogen fixation NifU-like protein
MATQERSIMDAPKEPTDRETTDFWQDHSLAFLEMAFRSDRRERVAQADGYAKKTGDCGDTVELFLMVKNGIIKSLSYEMDGCLHTNACCNAVACLVEGKPVESAWEITPETINDLLETLPEDHFHCAELVVGTLYLALSDARENRRSPWKKIYR